MLSSISASHFLSPPPTPLSLSLSVSFFFFFRRRICDEGMVQNRNKRVLIKEKKGGGGAEGFGQGANERRRRRRRRRWCFLKRWTTRAKQQHYPGRDRKRKKTHNVLKIRHFVCSRNINSLYMIKMGPSELLFFLCKVHKTVTITKSLGSAEEQSISITRLGYS